MGDREDRQFEEEYRKFREREEFKACMPEFIVCLFYALVFCYTGWRAFFG